MCLRLSQVWIRFVCLSVVPFVSVSGVVPFVLDVALFISGVVPFVPV